MARYAQFKGGLKFHIVAEPGEVGPDGKIVLAGTLSWPFCGARADDHYRMTINVPLGNSCRNCCRIVDARERKRGPRE